MSYFCWKLLRVFGLKWKAKPGAGHVPTMEVFVVKRMAGESSILGVSRDLWYTPDDWYYIFQNPSEITMLT